HAELLQRLDLNRRAALGAHFLSLEIGDGANAFVREQHHRAVDAGCQNLDALSAPKVARRLRIAGSFTTLLACRTSSNRPGASSTWKRGSRLTQKPFAALPASIVPSATPSTTAGSWPSWFAG